MGRPSFAPTETQRADVRQWVKARVAIEEMARRIGITPKTFRKQFAAELGLSPVNTVTVSFRPRIEQRQSVLILAGARISYPEIARKIGVTEPVLREHFAEELRDGPGTARANGIEAMYHAMLGGNVAAAKVYLTFNAQPEESPEQPARIGLTGKKEAAAIAARTAEAGTAWADLVTPDTKPN